MDIDLPRVLERITFNQIFPFVENLSIKMEGSQLPGDLCKGTLDDPNEPLDVSMEGTLNLDTYDKMSNSRTDSLTSNSLFRTCPLHTPAIRPLLSFNA